jgi:hypothetical protein
MKHKYWYDDNYVLDISAKIYSVLPTFDQTAFSNELIGNLDDKELFARFDFIVDVMEKTLGSDYSKSIQAFFIMLGPEWAKSEGMLNYGYWLWPISRYIERHGTENWRLSLSFLKELTKRFTSE